jgi:hypothetical protein
MIKEAEDFSTMVNLAAKNLYSYVNLIAFIMNQKNVRKAIRANIGKIQLSIFEYKRGDDFEQFSKKAQINLEGTILCNFKIGSKASILK